MRSIARWSAAIPAAATLAALMAKPAALLEPAPGSLEAGLGAARALLQEARPLAGTAGAQPPEALIRPAAWTELPRPEPQALAWLKSRVPDLDADKVRLAGFEIAERVMDSAVSGRLDYLELFTQEAFRRGEVFFLPQDALERIGRKYVTGAIPVEGKASDGRPFRMQGFLAGGGRLEFLYDREQRFDFKADAQGFRVERGGRVSCRIQDANDVTARGLSVHAFAWVYTAVQRMVKESPGVVRVYAEMGSGTGEIKPIRLK